MKKSDVPAGTCLLKKKDFLKFSGLVLRNIFVVFLSSSRRETAKHVIKKTEEKKRQETLFFPLNFFGKRFLTWTPPQELLVVFLKSPC
jgi:hypothetical protein